jgi:AcrR family transcriptional regulator
MDAGAAMLLEEATRNPFAGMRVRELCSRAGYSTGAFYAHWSDSQQFHLELANHLLAGALEEDFEDLGSAAERAAQLGGLEAIVQLADSDIEILLRNEQWDAVELLTVTWARTSLREAACKGYRTMDTLTAQTYQVVLDALDREPREPLELRHIGVVLQALVEGFTLRAKVDPEGIRSPGKGTPSLYSTAIAAVLVALTCPRGEAGSVVEVLDEELARGGGATVSTGGSD